MVALQERLAEFDDAGATVLGVSPDPAFSLGAFRDEYDIEFDLVSDMASDAIQEYGLEIDIPELGLYGIANSAVFFDDVADVDFRALLSEPERGRPPDSRSSPCNERCRPG